MSEDVPRFTRMRIARSGKDLFMMKLFIAFIELCEFTSPKLRASQLPFNKDIAIAVSQRKCENISKQM